MWTFGKPLVLKPGNDPKPEELDEELEKGLGNENELVEGADDELMLGFEELEKPPNGFELWPF